MFSNKPVAALRAVESLSAVARAIQNPTNPKPLKTPLKTSTLIATLPLLFHGAVQAATITVSGYNRDVVFEVGGTSGAAGSFINEGQALYVGFNAGTCTGWEEGKPVMFWYEVGL